MTYIQHLATDLLQRFGTDMSRVAVVFPNKRASLFLNKELAKQAALNKMGGYDSAVWAPSYITISELFRLHSPLQTADQILLVCRLYDVFCRCTGYSGETLDHFYNWGLLLLSDFDDLDKNMADAEKVFCLVGNLHEYDDTDFLSDTQRAVLKEFFETFNDDHTSMLRQKFLQLWSKLYEIYTTFREELRRDNLAYEGMLYRDVCEHDDLNLDYDCYCFVGFNMLQQVEQQLFHRIRKSGKALFYWDYDNYYLNNHHEAGHFIKEYLGAFPDAMDCKPSTAICKDNFTATKQSLTYISAPTETLQARYIHDWLLEQDRWKAGPRTAIVMADERLLQTIIRSLPEEVQNVNITTGYPLSQSPMTSLLHLLIEMQIEGRIANSDKYRLRNLNAVLQHPFASIISPMAPALYSRLNESKIYYPSRPELLSDGDDEGMAILFTDLSTMTSIDTSMTQKVQETRIFAWLMQITQHIARQTAKLNDLDSEALFRTYQVLQRIYSLIADGTLDVDIATLRRLLMQIISSTTIPYHGEPVAGIQIMGILETRCLDFDHVLVLSCNEGNMPKGVNDASFIPHSVRLAHGMTTVEHKVGIYSYYFHRLLQRSSDVSLAYNSSTEGMNSGEMSRFMLQLMVESGLPIIQRSLQSGQSNAVTARTAVEKDEQVMQRILKKFLGTNTTAPSLQGGRGESLGESPSVISPSSLSVYLRCQLRYYYQHIMDFREQDDDIDEMDSRVFGNIFHKAAELAYQQMKDADGWIHADTIRATMKSPSAMSRFVDEAFATELFHLKDPKHSYRPEYSGMQLINRKVILRLLHDLLQYDIKVAPIRIMGTEAYVKTRINIGTEAEPLYIKIGGYIDRLDMVVTKEGLVPTAKEGLVPAASTAGTIRVIDYKTGFSDQGKMDSIEAIFDPANISRHSDYHLQAMLYSYIVRHDRRLNPDGLPVSPGLLFIQKAHTEGYSPILRIADEPILDIKDKEDEYLEHLSAMISDIMNPEIPFAPTSNTAQCQFCPFSGMCK